MNIFLTSINTDTEEYRSIRAATFDQMNTTSMVVMEMWHSSVRKWYSATSNRNQMTVAPARTPADKYLFLHSKMSATTTPRRHNIKHPLWFRVANAECHNEHIIDRFIRSLTFFSAKKIVNGSSSPGSGFGLLVGIGIVNDPRHVFHVCFDGCCWWPGMAMRVLMKNIWILILLPKCWERGKRNNFQVRFLEVGLWEESWIASATGTEEREELVSPPVSSATPALLQQLCHHLAMQCLCFRLRTCKRKQTTLQC